MAPPLVLASRSPQRRAILEQLGIVFDVRATAVAEVARGAPADVARENALRKAGAAAAQAQAPDEIVLGVDTVVALDAEVYGKPADEHAARATLGALSGRTHEVVSGLALVRGGKLAATATAVTDVSFRELDAATISRYVETGEWRDRAGGYAIQGRGAALVRRIDGDYFNVVGLPIAALIETWPELLEGRC